MACARTGAGTVPLRETAIQSGSPSGKPGVSEEWGVIVNQSCGSAEARSDVEQA